MPILNLFSSIGSESGQTGIDISPAVVTLVSNSFVYDGTLKTQNMQSVVLNGDTLVYGEDYYATNNEATDAGSYVLYVVGIGDYYGSVPVSWSIAKLTPTLTLSETEVQVDEEDSTTITVSANSDGAISVSSSDTAVATVSISGNTITISGLTEGEATVTVSVASTSNCNATSATCSVEVGTSIPAVLSDCTPEQIQAAYRAGIASTLWSVGDLTAPIRISSSSSLPNFTPLSSGVQAYILGFDHNSSKEGNGIHLQFGKLSNKDIAFVDSGYDSGKTSGTWFNMNNSGYNTGGWSSSTMRVVCSAFLSCLSSSWQNVISEVTKYSDNTGGGSDITSYVTSTTDKIFLLSEYEVQGARTAANSAEQNNQLQYDYYKNGNSKIKYKHNATSTACHWWLRSVHASYAYAFCIVSDGMSANGGFATASYGFAPGFVIS